MFPSGVLCMAVSCVQVKPRKLRGFSALAKAVLLLAFLYHYFTSIDGISL